jgi:hypothetical protein
VVPLAGCSPVEDSFESAGLLQPANNVMAMAALKVIIAFFVFINI